MVKQGLGLRRGRSLVSNNPGARLAYSSSKEGGKQPKGESRHRLRIGDRGHDVFFSNHPGLSSLVVFGDVARTSAHLYREQPQT
jgi:hypothetical protein